MKKYDFIIIGGGIAGSSMALLLKKKLPKLRIAILEKRHTFPKKVGESLNDGSAYFFKHILKVEDLLKKHVVKGGLRFYFPPYHHNLNNSSDYSSPSYQSITNGFQLDRSIFDNDLLERAKSKGIHVYRGAEFRSLVDSTSEKVITYLHNEKHYSISSKWVVDASGRSQVLTKKLGWIKENKELNTASTWVHLKKKDGSNFEKSKDDWPEEAIAPSRQATEHFMDKGLWVWKFPISKEIMSLGIVYDKNVYRPKNQNPRKDFISYLEGHGYLKQILELYDIVKTHHLTHLPYTSQHLIKNQIVAIGEAASFVDPLFSPGIEMIANEVSAIVQIVQKSYTSQKNLSKEIKKYNKVFLQAQKSKFSLYKNRYETFDDAQIFSVWTQFDISGYLAGYIYPLIWEKLNLKTPASFPPIVDTIYQKVTKRIIYLYGQKKKLNLEDPIYQYHSYFWANKNISTPFKCSSMFFIRYLKLEFQLLTRWLSSPIRKVEEKSI